MWKLTCKLLFMFILVVKVQTYIKNDNQYYRSGNSKSSYLNYEFNRFQQQQRILTTERPTWNRNYQNHNDKKYFNMRTEAPSFDNHKIRHTNTRFPHMDKLLTKISTSSSSESDNINNNKPMHRNFDSTARRFSVSSNFNSKSDTHKKNTHKWITDSPFRRYTTTTTTESPDEFEEYDDFEDEEGITDLKKSESLKVNAALNSEDDDFDDIDEDDDEEDEEETEDDEEDDESNNYQAEEPTEEPTERSLTEYKWRHYGTRARVEESRRNHAQQQNATQLQDVQEAVEHARRVNIEGACRIPRARVVRIQSAYPDTGKTYIPHCTILHRCADDTGCCRLDSYICAPKHTVKLDLLFYTGRPGGPYRTERLAFYNHTECHCIERTQEMMARDAADTGTDSKYPVRPGPVPRSIADSRQQPPAQLIRRCRCPELYNPHISKDGICRCNCEEGNRDCMRIKRGKEYFSLKDRLCIQRGECGFPACEFGGYIRQSGRCPKKQEKFEAFSRVAPQ